MQDASPGDSPSEERCHFGPIVMLQAPFGSPGRPPPKYTVLEKLVRGHTVYNHLAVRPLVEMMVRLRLVRASDVTADILEQYNRLGCHSCERELMRRPSIPPLKDASRAPPGLRWTFDTLTLPCKSAGTSHMELTTFIDDGSRIARAYTHKDYTDTSIKAMILMHNAWVRAKTGKDVAVYRKDNHPTYRSKSTRQQVPMSSDIKQN